MSEEAQAEHHILNLGAGVQSTALYLMFMRGELQPPLECAIFADTQEEPAAVYEHLVWLTSLNGPPILNRTRGKLGNDLVLGVNSTGQRFSSIPSFTKADGEKREGRLRRQCSKEYKTQVIEGAIRREVLGLTAGRRVPRGLRVHQYFGISADEAGRARRITERLQQTAKWAQPHFPLIERFITRADCLRYLADKVPYETPRSACVFCPYHSDAEWLAVKNGRNGDWERALEIDRAIREHDSVCNKELVRPLYLHRSCVPLDLVQLDPRPKPRDAQLSIGFWAECEGVCGV